MWLRRGTRFPLTHGWCHGRSTGMAMALPVRAFYVHSVGSTSAGCISVLAAKIQSSTCRHVSVYPDRQDPWLNEPEISWSALARGPPIH